MKHMKVIVAISMAICLVITGAITGCQAQKEETAQEQLEKYRALESYSDFMDLSTQYLQAVIDCCTDPSNPSSIEDTTKAVVNLKRCCDDLINETEVPEKCKTLHEEYKTAAEKLEEAADHYSDANIALHCDDIIGATNDLEKGNDAVNEVAEAITRGGEIQLEILGSEDNAE